MKDATVSKKRRTRDDCSGLFCPKYQGIKVKLQGAERESTLELTRLQQKQFSRKIGNQPKKIRSTKGGTWESLFEDKI